MQEVDRKFWQQQEVDKIQTMKQERKLALTHRERLKRMEADRNVYLNKLKSQRYSSYKVSIVVTISGTRGHRGFRIVANIVAVL